VAKAAVDAARTSELGPFFFFFSFSSSCQGQAAPIPAATFMKQKGDVHPFGGKQGEAVQGQKVKLNTQKKQHNNTTIHHHKPPSPSR
jgi:hypothetical protein